MVAVAVVGVAHAIWGLFSALRIIFHSFIAIIHHVSLLLLVLLLLLLSSHPRALHTITITCCHVYHYRSSRPLFHVFGIQVHSSRSPIIIFPQHCLVIIIPHRKSCFIIIAYSITVPPLLNTSSPSKPQSRTLLSR